MHAAGTRMAIKRRGLPWSASWIIAAAVAGMTPCAAQAQVDTSSEPAAVSEPPGLTEIIVTARKRVESMQTIPESIDAFGPERCMFASNFPIDKLHAQYAALWRAYEGIVAGAPEAERDALLADNAIRHYRLQPHQ